MPDRSIVYRFLGQFGSLNAGLATAGRNTQEFGKKLTALDRDGAKMRAGLDQVGRTAGRVGLVAAGGLAAATKAAIDWESAWAGVAKTVDGTSGQMTQLEADLREMARTMPATHEEIAATAEAAGQLGVATENVADFTKIMIELGETTNLTADQASTSIAQFMNVMGTASDRVDEIGNTLVDLGNKGASTEAEIMMMAQRLSGAGKLIGASEADVLGLASAMANLGIEAQLGGGAMSRVIAIIQKDVAKGGEGLQEFAAIAGMSADEFAEQWQTNPVLAIDALLRGLNGVKMSGGDVIGTLDSLGIKGTQNRDVMLRLAGAGDMLTKSLDQSADAWDKNDALYEEYARRLGTTAAEVKIAWNNIKDAGIEAGQVMLPVVSKAADSVSDLAGAFNALPGPAKSATTGLLGITAVLGGGLWFGSKVIGSVVDTKQALADLGIQAPKTAGAIRNVGRVATVTAGLLAGLEIASKFLSDSSPAAGTEATEKAIRSVGISAEQASESIDKLFTRQAGGAFFLNNESQKIEGLADALRKLDESSWRQFSSAPLLGDSKYDLARESIKKLDETMAQMVQSGDVESAAAMFAYFNSTAQEVGYSSDEAAAKLPQYADALVGIENSAIGASGATGQLTGATTAAGGAALTSAEATKKLQNQWKKQAEQAEEVAESFVGLGDSLNDSKVSLDDWIKQLQEQADALKNFRVNAETAAKKGLRDGLIKELSAAGPEGAMRMRQLANATKSEIDKANTAWRSQRREVNLTKEALAGVRPPDPVAIEVKTFDAMMAIARLKVALSQVRSKDVNVNVHYRNIGNRMAGQAQARQNATGGYISGPGTETSDSILSWLSNGEFVMRASAVRRYGADFMAALNAERFADGGQAGDPPRRKGMTVRGRLGDNEYELHVGKSVASATAALGQMRRIVERLNGRLESMNVNVRESERIVKRETRARDRLADKVDAQQAALDDLTGKAWGLASTIREGLSANQFESVAASGNVWDAGTGDRMATFSEIIERLNASTEDSDAFSKAAMVLGGSLSGGALESVLAQGLDTTSMFAKLSPEELAQYQATFDRNVAAKSVAGGVGGGTVYGRDMAKAEQILAASQAELVRQNEALTEANRAANQAERRRDRAEKQRDQARDDRKDIKSELADIRRELAKNRKEAESGSRSRRSK